MKTSRREFLEFLGSGSAVAATAGSSTFLTACAGLSKPRGSVEALKVGASDSIELAPGFTSQVLIAWDDPINSREKFGTNADYLAFFRLNEEGTDGILWVNHESTLPLLVSGYSGGPRTRDQVVKEQHSIGGSLLRVQKTGDEWKVVPNDKHNRRITAQTVMPLIAPRPISGSRSAIGMVGNCAGGATPWGTVLTCEENYDEFYGETVFENGKPKHVKSKFGWEQFFPHAPEHYGWVVEVEPLTGKAKKLTALGRVAHECATVRLARDGRAVVYTGDDGNDRCLYKFIAKDIGSLEKGELFVADVQNGKWISLDRNKHEILKKNFKDQTEVLVRCREAAPMVGGSLLDRPEDIEIDPINGAVFITLTNNQKRGNFHGSIMKLEEAGNDPLAMEFKSSTFLAGGLEAGFSCPDNLTFDARGNLWMTNDISGKQMNLPEYAPFGNNGLFFIAREGENAGRAIRVASAPNHAEFTGPVFSHDGETLFLSVQHPGEESKTREQLTSHWPRGGDDLPRSAVVAISGPVMKQLVAGERVKPVFEIPVLKMV